MHLADNFAFKLRIYILSVFAFPGNRIHDLGITNVMLYCLSYRKVLAYVITKTLSAFSLSLRSCKVKPPWIRTIGLAHPIDAQLD